MKIAFNLPLVSLRCAGCDATNKHIDISRPRCEAEIACVCVTPAFELVFESVQHKDPLAVCPVVPR